MVVRRALLIPIHQIFFNEIYLICGVETAGVVEIAANENVKVMLKRFKNPTEITNLFNDHIILAKLTQKIPINIFHNKKYYQQQ